MMRFGLTVCLISTIALTASAAFGQAGKGLNKCQAAMSKESDKYIRAVAGTVGKCLNKMSGAVIGDGVSTAAAATLAAKTCVAALRKIVNTDKPSKQLADTFDAKVGKACDPAINPGLPHMESDTYTVGAATLSAANLDAYCGSFGGTGTIGDFDDWRDCLRTAAECEAPQSVAVRWPRALETAITSLPASPATADALAALATLDTAMEGATDDDVSELGCGPASGSSRWRHDMVEKAKNTICLWYDCDAEDAARFYAMTFPDSSVGAVHAAPGDFPSGKKGDVLTVEFTVMGIPCLGLNGGPAFKHNEAFSFQIATADQAETDRYWNAIVGNGGEESECGWCKDKWGLSWQITPLALTRAIADPDPAAAKRAFDAMMQMKKIDIAVIEAARRG